MRRALCVTPFAPLPPTEGHRKRILSTIGLLKRLGFSLDLLLLSRDYFWQHSGSEAQFSALRELADGFHVVPGDYPTRDDSQDWKLDDWMSPCFEAYVQWLAGVRNYDVVFCNYVFLSQALTYFPKSVCRILETHDRFGGRRQMLSQNASRIEFFYTTEREEAIGLNRSDLVIAIKHQEEQHFKSISTASVLTLPYVEETRERASSRALSNRARYRKRSRAGSRSKESLPVFGYFASSNWINRENFYRFIKCYKGSKRFMSGERCNLEIYGSLCNVIEGHDDAYVSRGLVKEAAEVYQRIDCVIIPQEFSTGLKIKVSEALSFGTPVIAHAHALEGFPVQRDSLMSCQSFEELVERCFMIQAKPSLLKKLYQEGLTTQQTLVEEVAAAEAAIGNFIERRLPTICIVADAYALCTDKIYFEVLQCMTSTISRTARISLCVYGAPQIELHDFELRGGRHINEFWCAQDVSELERWIEGRRAWLMLILTPDAELAERVQRDGFGEPGQVLIFRDCCSYAAAVSEAQSPAACTRCTEVSSRPPRQGQRGLPFWHFGWLPWSLSFAGALSPHVISERGFLFTRCRASANPALLDHLELVSLEPSDKGAMGPREFVEILLTRRVKPRLVVDETGFDPQFRLIFEVLHLNGVPILSTSEEDADFLYAGGIADWRSSCLFDQVGERPVAGRAPAGYEHIWDVLQPRIDSLQEALSRQPGAPPEGALGSSNVVLSEHAQLGTGLAT